MMFLLWPLLGYAIGIIAYRIGADILRTRRMKRRRMKRRREKIPLSDIYICDGRTNVVWVSLDSP